jgi:hypothetical protein
MQKNRTKLRFVAAIGAAAVAIPAAGSSVVLASGATAVPPKPKPACQGEMVPLGKADNRYGLELYTWKACGRQGGIPFG